MIAIYRHLEKEKENVSKFQMNSSSYFEINATLQ